MLELIDNIKYPLINPYKNEEMICTDPVSLNMLHCTSAGDKIKRAVSDFLATSKMVKKYTI